MSFILQALSRAQVLHGRRTAALVQPTAGPAALRASWPAMRIAGVLAALGAAALAASWSLRPKVEAVPVMTTATPLPSTAASSAVSSAASSASTPASASAAAPAPPASAPAAAPIARVPQFAPPTHLSQPLPPPRPRHGGPASVPPPPPLAPVAVHQPPAVEAPKPVSALPAALQARLGDVKVRLHVYAPQRGRRFVMVETRQLREGDELLEHLHLDEITPTGMVLRHEGLRVFVPAATAAR